MIRELILRWARNREPDFVIGGKDDPYLRCYWLLPRNGLFNVYVHEFLRSDDDRALHDHPWMFNASWILDGKYREWTPPDEAHLMPDVTERCRYAEYSDFHPGEWRFRCGAAPHRIELLQDMVENVGWEMPCWTLFITGPRVREWGFHCPDRGWIHWKLFTASDDPGAVGKGCAG